VTSEGGRCGEERYEAQTKEMAQTHYPRG
jgi:hypothetical protein